MNQSWTLLEATTILSCIYSEEIANYKYLWFIKIVRVNTSCNWLSILTNNVVGLSIEWYFVDLILKAHRSSDDVFLSPAVPKLRETKSSSPPDASKNTQLSKLPKPDNHLKALVSQQRHHILAAVNGRLSYYNYRLYSYYSSYLCCYVVNIHRPTTIPTTTLFYCCY